jgi:hypothetical protein
VLSLPAQVGLNRDPYIKRAVAVRTEPRVLGAAIDAKQRDLALNL